jgi:hypothetical protein
VNGFDAILNISSVNILGKINGTLYTGNTTIPNSISSMIAVCTAAHPCWIDGSFDTRSGKISFMLPIGLQLPTMQLAIVQNYTGYLSQRFSPGKVVDVIKYTIVILVMTHYFSSNKGFGWDASMSCIVMGPCSGGVK